MYGLKLVGALGLALLLTSCSNTDVKPAATNTASVTDEHSISEMQRILGIGEDESIYVTHPGNDIYSGVLSFNADGSLKHTRNGSGVIKGTWSAGECGLFKKSECVIGDLRVRGNRLLYRMDSEGRITANPSKNPKWSWQKVEGQS